jgi:hypothetical protein
MISCRSAFVVLLLLSIFTSPARAQQSSDSTIDQSLKNTNQIYLSEIGDNAQIYHGREFIRNGLKAIGYPFYESDNMLTGSLSYQGEIYKNRNLYYNLVYDQLITDNYPRNALITLSPEKVDSFMIGEHIFIPLTINGSPGLEKDGYYDRLVTGQPSLYARREKRLVVGTGSEETRYIQYNSYFIEINNSFHPVDGKTALIDLFKDKEDLVKKYIHANKLNFRKDLEYALIQSTIYYSQLKN